MIKNIIFDLGNVILEQKNVTADVYFAQILNVPVSEAKGFYEKYKRQAVAGEITFNELTLLFKSKFSSERTVAYLVNEYVKLYIKDVAGVNAELVDLVKSLNRNYQVYIMTNTLEPHFYHWKTLNLMNHFKQIFRSDTDHFIKPDREAYEFVVKEIHAKPQECVFIDDLEVNVRGAEIVGIKGIVYKNPRQLKQDLVKIGVTI